MESEALLSQPLLGTAGGYSSTNGGTPEIAVYPRRYFALFVLSVISLLQSCVWLTFSPIETEAQDLYGWEDWNVKLFPAWGPIIFCMLVPYAPLDPGYA